MGPAAGRAGRARRRAAVGEAGGALSQCVGRVWRADVGPSMRCAAAGGAACRELLLRDTQPLTLRAAPGLLSVLLAVKRGALAAINMRCSALDSGRLRVAGCGAAPPAGGVGLPEQARV